MRDVTSGGTVLVVDDHRELAENVVEILEELGFSGVVAESAEQALEVVSTTEVVGIVADHRLPGMSGLEMLTELRRRGFDRPIIMVSAYVTDRVVDEAERVGALAVLDKPVDTSRLLDLAREFAHERRDVLVVEDNRELARDVADALSGAGIEPVVVASVKAAFAQRRLPRAALVDLRLPDGSGADVARRLAARDPRIRLLVMTGHPDDPPVPDASEPVITKPADVATLIERVTRAVDR